MKKLLICGFSLIMSLQPLSAKAEGLSMFEDLLIWHVSEETTSTWVSVITESRNNELNYLPADTNFNWRSGFRGGLLYEPVDNFWDTKLYWTYFSTKSSGNYSPTEQIILPEFFSGFVSKDIFFGARMGWQFIMNTLDLTASHEFNVSESFAIRPSIGVKGATIKQAINAEWNAEIYTSTEKVKHNFSGVGPSFGIDAKWNFYNNFNLASNFAAAFMWGWWNISDTYYRPSAALGLIEQTTIHTKVNNSQLGTLMLDYFLGIEWVHHGRSDIALKLGYEMQYWANQSRLPLFQQLPVHGDLTLGGATCGISINL